MLPIRVYILFVFMAVACGKLWGQSISDSVIRPAGPQFQKSSSHTKWWGQHYRREWATPVQFRTVLLDTLEGGLIPFAEGTDSLRRILTLKDKKGRKFILRSLQKTFPVAVPPEVSGTFIEKIIKDQVSIGHPYAPLTIPPLARAAGIYHSAPRLYFIPHQPALGIFNRAFGNDVYLFELQVDEDLETARNFGDVQNIVGTNTLRERLLEDARNTVDQKLFARSRLFDMFIGDWNRHGGQWKWAEIKTDKGHLYRPMPIGREMAFSLLDGRALKAALPAAGLKHAQGFGPEIKDMKYYNFAARNLDLHLTNSLSLDDWQQIASDLQKRLTDNVIHESVKLLPPEIYPISGLRMEQNLRNRRDQLHRYAELLYTQLAEYPVVTGSQQPEEFRIEYLGETSTRVSIHFLKNGKVDPIPVYQRIFSKGTEEIRVHGIGGEDKFMVSGKVDQGVKVRLIGGDEKDMYKDNSSVKKTGRQVKIYDDKNNTFIAGRETALKVSAYPSVHRYDWDGIRYHKSGIRPIAFYNNADRIYVGMRYARTKFGWRKQPYGNQQKIDVKYSISQRAPSINYEGIFTDLLGKFDLDVTAYYDWIRWTNFHGLGNETPLETDNRDFYRLRSKDLFISAGLSYRTRNRHRFSILPYFQTISFLKDEERFVSQKGLDAQNELYDTRKFAGANVEYVYQKINDSILPKKGIAWHTVIDVFSATGSWKTAASYSTQLQLLLPVSKKIGFNFRLGGSTLSGRPEFFKYNSIGGSETLRGFQRGRFYGNSTAFIQNEIRWISRLKSYWYAGSIGFFGFVDAGRVWLKGEKSRTWHIGYGPGVIVSPLNKISVWLAYGLSKDDNNFHFRIIRPF